MTYFAFSKIEPNNGVSFSGNRHLTDNDQIFINIQMNTYLV